MGRPSPTGDSGRDERGRFIAGNGIGTGNPHAKQVARLRSALLDAVTPNDMTRIARKLVAMALDGDVHAAQILFDRCLGRPLESDVLSRIEELESALEVSA